MLGIGLLKRVKAMESETLLLFLVLLGNLACSGISGIFGFLAAAKLFRYLEQPMTRWFEKLEPAPDPICYCAPYYKSSLIAKHHKFLKFNP